MRLNENDVQHLIRACKSYQEKTGSEFMWDTYEDLIEKLRNLCEQGYCAITEGECILDD